jgi:branched-chain amino acid transport system substrate-binding protein
MRRWVTLALVLALVLALAAVVVGCGSSSETTTTAGATGTSAGGTATTAGGGTAAGGTIKIGALYPLTGDLAKLGEDNLNGLQLAVDEINAAGGIKSMGGAKIELVKADSQGQPNVGISEVDRLVQQDKVCAIVGTYQSKVAIPTTQEAEKLQTPMVISMAVADTITDRGFKYTFRIAPKADWYAKDQVSFLKDMKALTGLDVKKVALLHEDSDFGTSTAAGQKKYLKEAGIDVTTEVSYPASAADLTTQVNKVKATNPDAVLTVTYLNDAILIAQAKQKLSMKQPFIDAAGGTVDVNYIKRAGASAEDMLTEVEYTKYAKGAAPLNDKFKAKYGRDINGNSAYAYQAGYVLADALERAATASCDRQKLRDALAATNMPAGPTMVLPTQALQFGTDGQNKSAPLFVVQVQNGQLIPVWPQQYAAAKVNLPK